MEAVFVYRMDRKRDLLRLKMSAIAVIPATLDDLLQVDGKAELLAGRIVKFMASGDDPSTVAFEIAVHLREYAKALGRGKAYADGIGFAFPSPLMNGRQSFSPDAAFHLGPFPRNAMKFVTGSPTFAVEVRSESDRGPAAKRDMADKRDDYFEAGTLVVWDVDPDTETIYSYAANDPTNLISFRKGDFAHAEPALPGWRLKVDDVFA